MYSLKVLVILFLITTPDAFGFWFFGGKSSEDTSNDAEENTLEVINNAKDPKFKHVPFEIKTVDERLLQESLSISQLSQLDSCFHMVMSELEGSCISMSEEELSKLSVRLMNCQSRVEGRRTYPCTSDMELKECTSSMDETVWNAYQIISNRARSVCYQIRHQQFRLKTELTVNKLVESSEEQLKSLREMEIGHESLRQLTEDVMKRVQDGQATLLDNQFEMTKAQQQVEAQIEKNRRQLSEEQKLISVENMKLVHIAEKIQDSLDNATEQISNQARAQSEMHVELMDDIGHIASETKRVIETLDEGSNQVKVLREQTDEHFEDVVKNLKVINGSVVYLAELIRDVQNFFHEKMDVVSFYINTSGKDIEFLLKVSLHVLYAFGLLILLAFFNIHSMFKLLLLLLVFCNVASHAYWGQSLAFSSLTMALLFFIIGYYITPIGHIRRRTERKDVKAVRDYSTDSTEVRQNSGDAKVQRYLQALKTISEDGSLGGFRQIPLHGAEEFSSEENDDTDQGLVLPDALGARTSFLPLTPSRQRRGSTTNSPARTPKSVKRHLLRDFDMAELESRSTRSSRNNSPARTSTPKRNRSPARINESFLNRSMRPQCNSLTRTGLPCKLPCQEGSLYCHMHLNSADDSQL